MTSRPRSEAAICCSRLWAKAWIRTAINWIRVAGDAATCAFA
jgi:hypothetical protein